MLRIKWFTILTKALLSERRRRCNNKQINKGIISENFRCSAENKAREKDRKWEWRLFVFSLFPWNNFKSTEKSK